MAKDRVIQIPPPLDLVTKIDKDGVKVTEPTTFCKWIVKATLEIVKEFRKGGPGIRRGKKFLDLFREADKTGAKAVAVPYDEWNIVREALTENDFPWVNAETLLPFIEAFEQATAAE